MQAEFQGSKNSLQIESHSMKIIVVKIKKTLSVLCSGSAPQSSEDEDPFLVLKMTFLIRT